MKFSDTANKYDGTLTAFTDFPAAPDRDAYSILPDKLKTEIIETAEKYKGYKFPSIPATSYMAFVRTGNRVDFENIYFEKRYILCALILAECVEYKGRFADDIINGVFSICEESGWQLPAHNTYIRDTPQHILPDSDRPVIDLFAAETGALLAWVYYLLGDCLDQISPFITKRIISELNKRIYIPYTESHFWWMGNGDEKMCNWTAWCTQNVLLCAFIIPNEDTLLKKVFLQAAQSCDCFLKDYGEDGCCDEGAGYYRHAGLCLFGALNILNYISGGAFTEHFKENKIRNIAKYILNVHASGDYYFNFADCSAKPGPCGVREYLFGVATNSPDLCKLAAEDFIRTGGRLYTGAKDQINIYYFLMTIFHYTEVMEYVSHTDTSLSHEDNITSVIYNNSYNSDVFYESTGLFITRSDVFSLAVKAGHNDDNHNHNDTGSFILYKNGLPVFVDIGVESYTKKTFSDKRYEIWTMQSCYHNLPTIDGMDESPGESYGATDVAYSFDENRSKISMELATVYPVSHVSYKRSVILNKASGEVMLIDTTDCAEAVLNFILYEKPELTLSEHESSFTLGAHTKCIYSGAEFHDLDVLPITDPRLRQAWDHDLYRLRLKLKESPSHNERSFHLTII